MGKEEKKNSHLTARYRIIADPHGSRYRFFCEASGMVLCTTPPIREDTQEKELITAWDGEAKKYFNRCSACGKWISDTMYNADTGKCVDCSVWEFKPNYCTRCGKRISSDTIFCKACGARLRYREVIV